MTTVGDILRSTIDVVLDPENWLETCDRINHRYDCHTVIYSVDISAGVCGTNWFGGSIPTNVKRLTQSYMETPPHEEAMSHRFMENAPALKLFSECEAFGVNSLSDVPDSDWRRRVLGSLGNKTRVASKLNSRFPWLELIALHVPWSDTGVPKPVAHDFDVLLPVIARVLENSRVLQNITMKYGALLEVFERFAFGLAFLDSNGSVMFANSVFRDIAASKDGFMLDANQRLLGTYEGNRIIWPQFRTVQDLFSPKGPSTFTVKRRSGARDFVVHAAQARSVELGTRPVTILLVFDPDAEQTLDGEGLAQLGLLSNAEKAVCDLLIAGLETQEISERRSTTIETTRSQIKSASQKLNVHSRLDLLRLALATSAPLKRKSRI